MQATYFMGIDVSKNELDFAVVESNRVLFDLEVSNDKKGITDLMRQLKKQTPANFEDSLFCMEFTARAAPRYL